MLKIIRLLLLLLLVYQSQADEENCDKVSIMITRIFILLNQLSEYVSFELKVFFTMSGKIKLQLDFLLNVPGHFHTFLIARWHIPIGESYSWGHPFHPPCRPSV